MKISKRAKRRKKGKKVGSGREMRQTFCDFRGQDKYINKYRHPRLEGLHNGYCI